MFYSFSLVELLLNAIAMLLFIVDMSRIVGSLLLGFCLGLVFIDCVNNASFNSSIIPTDPTSYFDDG